MGELGWPKCVRMLGWFKLVGVLGWSFFLGGDQEVFDGAITFEVGLKTIPPGDLFNAFTETLGIWYYYVTLGFDFIGNRLGTSGSLAVSPIIDFPRRPVKSSLYLVQSPYGVFTVSK